MRQRAAARVVLLLLGTLLSPASSADDAGAAILYSQEVLIGRLHAALGELRAENAALKRRLALLDAGSATMDGVAAASAAALKTEVFRLVRKEVSGAGARAGEAAAGAEGAGPCAGAGAGAGCAGSGAGEQAGAGEDAAPADRGMGQWTRPQNVAIVCKDAASVHVAPLADEDRPNDECLVLRVQAPDLEARFVMYCDADAEDASTGSAAL